MHAKTLILALAGAALLGAAPALAQLDTAPASAADWAALPDWTGDWVVQRSKAPDPPAPYNAAWARKVAGNAAALKAGKRVDPLMTCGLPAGSPRMLSQSGIHEWIVRPGEVRHLAENGNMVQRIYTTGRQHPSGEDRIATYTGDNIGHWDGDTLVFDTDAMKPETWLDGTGKVHSGEVHVTGRVRKTGPGTLRADIVIEDPVAFTKPWKLVRTYRRLPEGSFVHDYACAIVTTRAQAAKMELNTVK